MIKPKLRGWIFLSFILALLPAVASAGRATFYDKPDTLLATNAAIDIIRHNNGVWMATGRGVNYSFDGGQTWLLYDSSNGLKSSDVSAIFSIDGRLWVGTNHYDIIQGVFTAISDGVTYTDDNGENWHQIIFDSTGLNIFRVWGGDRTVYDITGSHFQGKTWLFFTAFAGGLLASQDAGIHWRRVYKSASDSITFNGNGVPPFDSRYFSCVADSSHNDSLFLWVGTAGGVFQYIWSAPRSRMSLHSINRIALCDSCPTSYAFMAADNGFGRSLITGTPFISRTAFDGLPGIYISAVTEFGGRVFVGTATGGPGLTTGLAYSDNYGQSFTASADPAVAGANQYIQDFASVRNRLYMAAQEAGLFVSGDTGRSWTHIQIDTAGPGNDAFGSPLNRRNIVHALCSSFDTLWVGTDSGLVTYFFDSAGNVDSSRNKVFTEDLFSSAKVVRIKKQFYRHDSTSQSYDSTALWTINWPLTTQGNMMVGRSTNGFQTFQHLMLGFTTYDINYIRDTTFVVGDYGVRFTPNGTNPGFDMFIEDPRTGIRLDTQRVTSMEVKGDTVIFGGKLGLAYSTDRGVNFNIFKGNTDTLAPDAVVNYTLNSTLNIDSGLTGNVGLTGDFIPALATQHVSRGPDRIWATGRPVTSGYDGITVARYIAKLDSLGDTTGFKLRWDATIRGMFGWNYTFNGDTVFAATDSGLMMCTGVGFSRAEDNIKWDSIPFVNINGDTLVGQGKAAYAVRVIDTLLWVGTEEGTLRLNLRNLRDQRLFGYVDSLTLAPYAFPVPFAPSRDPNFTVKFHFRVDNSAGSNITLEVYDFAMNLVARVIDNQYYPQGIYHGNTGFKRVPEWNGRNGRGDVVAVGVYYFKVEYSTGEVKWGKLAVIP